MWGRILWFVLERANDKFTKKKPDGIITDCNMFIILRKNDVVQYSRHVNFPADDDVENDGNGGERMV